MTEKQQLYTYELEEIDLQLYKDKLLNAYKAAEILTEFGYFNGELNVQVRNFLEEIEKEVWRLGARIKLVPKYEREPDSFHLGSFHPFKKK